MKEIKFHKGNARVCNVSLENFVEVTKEKNPYLKIGQNGKEAYAICPLCENPVKILGIYAKLEKQQAHARHFKENVPGLADFDMGRYMNCPYHRRNADYVREIRKSEDITPLNIEVLLLAHDHFDKCIYILKKVTGLVISVPLAKAIAMDYMAHPGYMTYDINRENVPYIMGLCMVGKTLIKRLIVKDSPLYEMLKNRKEISLVPLNSSTEHNYMKPLYRIESNIGYLDLCFNISCYRYSSNPTSGFQEYIKLHIGIADGNGTYNTYAEKEISVDPFLFSKLVHSTKAQKPKQELLDIADQILVL